MQRSHALLCSLQHRVGPPSKGSAMQTLMQFSHLSFPEAYGRVILPAKETRIQAHIHDLITPFLEHRELPNPVAPPSILPSTVDQEIDIKCPAELF